MLKYHLIVSNKNKQNLGTFNHYFNLGSHQSPYVLDHIEAFSIITLNPKQKLPTISNNQEEKFSTLAIPLKGKLKINGQIYQGEVEQGQKFLWNPKNISTADGDEKSASFAYIAVKGELIKQLPVQLKRYTQNTVLELQKSFVFVIEGKLTYLEEDVEVTIKNKSNFEELPLLFYARKNLKIAIDKNSLILTLRDRL